MNKPYQYESRIEAEAGLLLAAIEVEAAVAAQIQEAGFVVDVESSLTAPVGENVRRRMLLRRVFDPEDGLGGPVGWHMCLTLKINSPHEDENQMMLHESATVETPPKLVGGLVDLSLLTKTSGPYLKRHRIPHVLEMEASLIAQREHFIHPDQPEEGTELITQTFAAMSDYQGVQTAKDQIGFWWETVPRPEEPDPRLAEAVG